MSEIAILKMLKAHMELVFNKKADYVVNSTNEILKNPKGLITREFTINQFSLKSLNDSLLEENEVGLIHILQNHYTIQEGQAFDSTRELDYSKKTDFSIQVVMLDRGNSLDQVYLANNAIALSLFDINLDLKGLAYNPIISESESFYFGEEDIKYISTGIILNLSILPED